MLYRTCVLLLLSGCMHVPIDYYEIKAITATIKYKYLVPGMDCKDYAYIASKELRAKGYKPYYEHVVFGRDKHHRITLVQGVECVWVIDNRYATSCREWFTNYKHVSYQQVP